jgi:outer membrane lipoprotein carrier protein
MMKLAGTNKGFTTRRLLGAAMLAGSTLLFSGAAQAVAADALRDFVKGTRTGKVAFTQTIVNRNGKVSNPASGTFQFARPGKFRWVYDKPYEQWIVGDGDKLWIFDKDLNQVTVRKLGASLGQSPAAILAGSDDLEKNFTLTEAGVQDGIEWLEAVPKAKDTSFELVRIGFKSEGTNRSLAAMELRDTFGQTSVLKFGAVERNPTLAPETFQFTPPKGADVIGDSK